MDIEEAHSIIDKHVIDLIDLCPHCGAKVHIEKQWTAYHRLKNRSIEFYVIFRCRPCKKLILKIFYFEQNPYSGNENLEAKGWIEKYPVSFDDELSNEEKEFMPDQVLSDYQEALKCKSIGANRASCAMFRRALQSSLIILGANHKQDLIQQIDSLDSLPKDIKDWAHQIRIFGNWGAHPDKDNLKDVDIPDVIEAHDFISKFILYMFVMPEKVKLSRAKRDEKLKGKKEVSPEE